MSNIYFVCVNKHCHIDRWGGEIIEIPENEKSVYCPKCGQKYDITKDEITTLTVFDSEPIVIKSLKEVNSFQEKYTNIKLFITELHLKDISDNENFLKQISYKECFIERLIIENIDLSTSCFPIAFDGCHINDITIRNCRISDNGRKDFWGPYHFYGINFNDTKFYNLFDISNFQGSIIMKACEVHEVVKITESQLADLVLINNEKEPDIELENSEIINKVVLDAPAENNSGTPPEIYHKRAGKVSLKDQGKKEIIITDSYISKLIIPETVEFNSPVTVRNCIVEKLENNADLLNHDIMFVNCQFLGPVNFSNTTFGKQLVLEGNNFHGSVTFNKINVKDDLHLSYSSFYGGLFLYHTNVSGYLTMHQSKVINSLVLDNCLIDRNFTLVNSTIEAISFSTSAVQENLFLTSNDCSGKFKMRNTTIGSDLDFNKSTFYEHIDIFTSRVRENFRCTDCFLFNPLDFIECEVTSDIVIAQSNFFEKITFRGIKASSLFLFSNRFLGETWLWDCSDTSVSSTSYFSNNIFYDNFSLYQSKFSKQKISHNRFFNKLDLDDTKTDHIQILSNTINHFFVNQVNCESFELKYDMLGLADISELSCSRILVFEGSNFGGITQLRNSRFDRTFKLSSCSFSLSAFIHENRFNSLNISSCQFQSNVAMFKNNIHDRIETDNTVFSEILDLHTTYAGGIATFSNVEFHKTLVLDSSYFDKNINFQNCKINDLSLKDASLNSLSLPENWSMRKGRLVNGEGIPVLTDEKLLMRKNNKKTVSLQLIQSLIFEDNTLLKNLKTDWNEIKSNFIKEDNLPDELKKEGNQVGNGDLIPKIIEEKVTAVLEYQIFIDKLIQYKFAHIAYQYYGKDDLDELQKNLSELKESLDQNKVGSSELENISRFCQEFDKLIKTFISFQNQDLNIDTNRITPTLYERLKDQYLIIKEVFGNNGDLVFEDKAYFRRMHYKNLYELRVGNNRQKISKSLNWLVYEKIFGWGVDLWRVVRSTFYLVLLFTAIYWAGGWLNPELSISWEGVPKLISNMDEWDIFLLSLQTTFAAFMGDWSPTGMGALKVWMTLNAILGVLMVAFLIGAYGRKMLR